MAPLCSFVVQNCTKRNILKPSEIFVVFLTLKMTTFKKQLNLPHCFPQLHCKANPEISFKKKLKPQVKYRNFKKLK